MKQGVPLSNHSVSKPYEGGLLFCRAGQVAPCNSVGFG